jgi:hypothetical protein
MTDRNVVVVVADRVEEKAYLLGYRRFEGIGTPEGEEIDLEGFRGGAEYANHVLPDLRALAGHSDAGHGTYKVGGEIVIVDEADLDDDPITGETWTAEDYLNVLVDRWHDGARDALDADAEKGENL